MKTAKISFWVHNRTRRYVIERSLHSTKSTASVAISTNCIISSYWFEVENERPQTVNTERYLAVLMKIWASRGRRRGIDEAEK